MSDVAKRIIGESSPHVHEELLNKALKDVADVLNRRDLAALDKLEFIHQHTGKVREQLLGDKPK